MTVHLDEVFDTQMEVERDFYGAWNAIQSQAVELATLRTQIVALTAERDTAMRGAVLAGEENYRRGWTCAVQAVAGRLRDRADHWAKGDFNAGMVAINLRDESRILAALEPDTDRDEALIRAALEAAAEAADHYADMDYCAIGYPEDGGIAASGTADTVRREIRALATPEGIAAIMERAGRGATDPADAIKGTPE